MHWLFRLPRVLAVPVGLVMVIVASLALAGLACCTPLLLLALWVRRTVSEWQAVRLLRRLATMPAHAPLSVEGGSRALSVQPDHLA